MASVRYPDRDVPGLRSAGNPRWLRPVGLDAGRHRGSLVDPDRPGPRHVLALILLAVERDDAVLRLLGDGALRVQGQHLLQRQPRLGRPARDSHVGAALAYIHRSPERDWTNAALAETVAMSRSRFAARFSARRRAPLSPTSRAGVSRQRPGCCRTARSPSARSPRASATSRRPLSARLSAGASACRPGPTAGRPRPEGSARRLPSGSRGALEELGSDAPAEALEEEGGKPREQQ